MVRALLSLSCFALAAGCVGDLGAGRPVGGSRDSRPPPRVDLDLDPDAPLELSIDSVYRFVRARGIDSVEGILAELPDSLTASWVLMEESRSRHRASLERPRLIMYGLDARFIFAAGSREDDRLVDAVEMAELDEETGHWVFRVLDFAEDPPELTDNQANCVACHGAPARPIWGSYPNWPGAFAGQDDRLTGGQIDVVMRMKNGSLGTDRYSHLIFPSDHSIRNNGTLYLAGRQYGYANTVFNFELVVAVADGLVTRMSRHRAWPAGGYDVLYAFWCERSVEAEVEAYDAFGIEGPNDFQLAHMVPEANGEGYDTFGWNQGSTGLDDVVAFRLLDRLMEDDRELAQAVSGIEETRARWIHHWFELRGEARSRWLAEGFDLYDYDLRPQELVPRVAGSLCAYLENR